MYNRMIYFDYKLPQSADILIIYSSTAGTIFMFHDGLHLHLVLYKSSISLDKIFSIPSYFLNEEPIFVILKNFKQEDGERAYGTLLYFGYIPSLFNTYTGQCGKIIAIYDGHIERKINYDWKVYSRYGKYMGTKHVLISAPTKRRYLPENMRITFYDSLSLKNTIFLRISRDCVFKEVHYSTLFIRNERVIASIISPSLPVTESFIRIITKLEKQHPWAFLLALSRNISAIRQLFELLRN